MEIELGVFGFGDVATAVGGSVTSSSADQRLHDCLLVASATEAAGLDVFGVGEHHRPEFAISAPAVILAAIAERTSRIQLASVLTVLAADDPRRVLEQFATLDALSNGRAELSVGRDAFPEAFSLFGQRLTDADALLDEKLRSVLWLQREPGITSSGTNEIRRDLAVSPSPRTTLPIGVTASRARRPVELAAMLGLPLTIFSADGRWSAATRLIGRYRSMFVSRPESEQKENVTVLVPGHIAESREQAFKEASPYHAAARHLASTGIGPGGAPPMVIGDPDIVIEQILSLHTLFRPRRIMIELGRGGMPISETLHAVALLGQRVADAVRRELAQS